MRGVFQRYSPKIKHFAPPKISGLATPLCECYVREQFMETIVGWCQYCAFAHYLMQSEGCTSLVRAQRICVD